MAEKDYPKFRQGNKAPKAERMQKHRRAIKLARKAGRIERRAREQFNNTRPQ